MKANNKRNEFGRAARIAKKVKIRIQEMEKQREKDGKEPFTPEQKKRYIKWETKKELRKSNIRAMIFALVGTSALTGIGTTALLNEKNGEIKKSKSEISIDAGKEDKDIKIKNVPDDREVFVDGIKVNVESLKQDEENQLKSKIAKDVELLETQEELLNYIKDIYVEEYNKQNNDNITENQVSLMKKRADEYIYKDKANNGDMIFKQEYTNDTNKKYMDLSAGVITAIIDKGEATLKEKILNYNNEFKTVYNYSKDVEKYEDNTLVKVGDVIDKGIDWYVAREQEDTSVLVKDEYKNRFVTALTEYKNKQIEEIKQSIINEEDNQQTLE